MNIGTGIGFGLFDCSLGGSRRDQKEAGRQITIFLALARQKKGKLRNRRSTGTSHGLLDVGSTPSFDRVYQVCLRQGNAERRKKKARGGGPFFWGYAFTLSHLAR